LPRAIDDFERYCLGLLNELSLSEELLEKIDKAVKVLRHELNEESYLRVLHIWQESFSALAVTAFDYLDTDERKIIEHFESRSFEYQTILDDLNKRSEFK